MQNAIKCAFYSTEIQLTTGFKSIHESSQVGSLLGYLSTFIQNEGPKIEIEAKKLIFSMFAQSGMQLQNNTISDVGIGLKIAFALVKALVGRLKLVICRNLSEAVFISKVTLKI